MIEPTEAALIWRRSTRCEGGQCVEVAQSGAAVVVRDSKDPDGPTLAFSLEEWSGFLNGLRVGADG